MDDISKKQADPGTPSAIMGTGYPELGSIVMSSGRDMVQSRVRLPSFASF